MDSSVNPSISVVIPVFNEEKTVRKTIEEIKELKSSFSMIQDIICVEDCSTDGSYKVLQSIKGITVIQHSMNRGYGASIKTGIKASDSKMILITDSDGTYPVKQIPHLLRYVRTYDMVVGSRTGANVNIPFFRRPAKWFLNRFSSYLAGRSIPDLNSGMRVFDKEKCEEFWNLYPEKFSFTSTITMAFMTHNYTVKYVPINYYKRKGKSSISPFDAYNFTNLLIRLTLFFRPMKIFTSLAAILLLASIGIFIYSTFIMGQFMDITTLIFFISALQMFSFGLLAEIIIRQKR